MRLRCPVNGCFDVQVANAPTHWNRTINLCSYCCGLWLIDDGGQVKLPSDAFLALQQRYKHPIFNIRSLLIRKLHYEGYKDSLAHFHMFNPIREPWLGDIGEILNRFR